MTCLATLAAFAAQAAALPAAPHPQPGHGTLYFLAWQVAVCVAGCGLLTGACLRLLPFYKHMDPLIAIGLYTLLPVLLYIGATALALSWETGRPATGVIHLTIVWPYVGYAGCILAGKYAVEGARHLRRRRGRRARGGP